MSERFRRLIGAVAVIMICGLTGAVAQPLGDFGRPRDSVIHDKVLPALGRARASLGREPVSSLNLTDQEREMHDRVWRFLVSPHASDWFMDVAVKLQRTRIAGALDGNFKPDRYYRWLHQRRYASSRIRFRTIADDANTDVDTAPSTFAAICRVLEVDRQRASASFELDGLGSDEVADRRAENAMLIAWFTRALRFRYEAYNLALDLLLVETPHEEAIDADAEISSLAIYVERAERNEFCLEHNRRFGRGGDHPIPSRLLLGPAGEGEFRK